MGTVYNGFCLEGTAGGMEEITNFTWSFSYSFGAQWVTADLSAYEWVILSFIPSATNNYFKIRHYYCIPTNGSGSSEANDVGVSWRFSESPSSSTTYNYAACAHVYATSSGIYMRSIQYDKTVYLTPQAASVKLYGIR